MKEYTSIFDIVRLINVESKTVISQYSSENIKNYSQKNCFLCWHKPTICDDCKIINAVNQNKTIVDFQVDSGRSFIKIFTPYGNNEKLGLLLIQDVTTDPINKNIKDQNTVDIQQILTDLNDDIMTDDLTKLYNKRYAHQQLFKDVTLAAKNNESICIVIADIDYFKVINDTFGHLFGDKILAKIGKVIKNSIRNEGDWAARYGGEEFLLVFKGLDKDSLNRVVERIQYNMLKTPFDHDNELNISFSYGGLVINNPNPNLCIEYINEADKLLYNAKRNGRDFSIIEVFNYNES